MSFKSAVCDVKQRFDSWPCIWCGFQLFEKRSFQKNGTVLLQKHIPLKERLFCSLEVGKEGRVLLLPFLVPTFGSILESIRAFRAALKPWPRWDAAPGQLQPWLDVL